MQFPIPHPLKAEHETLHTTLRRATREPGAVGEAAKAVAKLLHGHFEKEEAYALPPLALLSNLARGKIVPEMKEVLAMTDRLKLDFQSMLQEHQAIVAALERLSAAAAKVNKPQYEEFAKALTQHAQMEEQVLYPTAILIGEYVKQRLHLAQL
jgi:hemerythrin superfamily protein